MARGRRQDDRRARFQGEVRARPGTYPQATGEAAVTRMKLAVDVAPEAKQFVKDWLTEKYDVKL